MTITIGSLAITLGGWAISLLRGSRISSSVDWKLKNALSYNLFSFGYVLQGIPKIFQQCLGKSYAEKKIMGTPSRFITEV